MARPTRVEIEQLPASSLASLSSAKNPDGTDYTLPVSGTVSTTPATPSAPVAQQVTATTTGVAFASQACKRIKIQNRLNDDSNTAQTNDVLIVIGGTNVHQLVPGTEFELAVDNANRITVKTFTGTELVVAAIEP